MTKIAMCTCGEPLVSTFAFSKYEFFCVHCGRKVTYFGPVAAEETPKLLKRIKENEAIWEEIGAGLLTGGVRLTSCDTCISEHQPHLYHATPDEVMAHEAAVLRVEAVGKKRVAAAP